MRARNKYLVMKYENKNKQSRDNNCENRVGEKNKMNPFRDEMKYL